MRHYTRKKRTGMVLDLPLTPLIDTALTLLIIFMVATPMMHNALHVKLPKATTHEEGGVEQPLVVTIDAQGTVFVADQQVDIQTLTAACSDAMIARSGGCIYVKADVAVRYGDVVQIVDRLKSIAGVTSVALATQSA